MVDITPQESILGSGAGGPLSLPTPWGIGPGYISYTTGGILIGVPTGGNQGVGSLNAKSIYIDGVLVNITKYLLNTGGTMTGPLILSEAPVNPLGATTKSYVDNYITTINATFLPLAGGTLTGPLALAADPTTPLGATTKQYTDRRLLLAGGTMTGPLLLAADPTVPLGTVTKQYADKALLSAGGSMTGPLVLAADPTANLQAATKQYVDAHAGAGGLADAPSDGTSYGRRNGAWENVLSLLGGTLTGPLLLAADPTVPLGTATKQYVDSVSGGIPSGSVMLFYQAAAPVGWTQVTTQNDKALRVVSGTGGVAGGTNAFSIVMAQSVVGGHTLSAAEIPLITSSKGNLITVYTPSNAYFPLGAGAWSYPATAIGSDPSHAKSTGSSSYANYCQSNVNITVNSTNTSGAAHNHPITMDIQYCDVIIASKN
jgi:hypothetical protein